jgi:hypothetical protein
MNAVSELETKIYSASLESFPFATQCASKVPSLKEIKLGISAGWRQKRRLVAIIRASDQAGPRRMAYRSVPKPSPAGSTQLRRMLPSVVEPQFGWMLPVPEGFVTVVAVSFARIPI